MATEPTLYKKVKCDRDTCNTGWHWEVVEPCVHGNYAPHEYHHRSKWGTESYKRCSGKPKVPDGE